MFSCQSDANVGEKKIKKQPWLFFYPFFLVFIQKLRNALKFMPNYNIFLSNENLLPKFQTIASKKLKFSPFS